MADKKNTLSFEGIEVEYNPSALTSWKVQKKIAQGGFATFEALDIILCGKADEVAEQLGDDIGKMVELAQALSVLSAAAKN